MKNLKFFIPLLVVLFMCSALWAKDEKHNPPKTLHKKVVKTLWSRGLKSGGSKKRFFPEASSPTTADGRVFVGTHSGNFYAVNAASGKILWTLPTEGPIASQALAVSQNVYFGNNKGWFYSVNAETGTRNWSVYLENEILGTPAFGQGKVYAVTTARQVFAIDADNGRVVWSTPVSGFDAKMTMRGTSGVVIQGDRLYIGFADGQLVALSAGNGSVVWSRMLAFNRIGFRDLDADITIDGDALYVSGYFGNIYKLSRSGGDVLWKKDIKSGVKLEAGSDSLYVSTADGHVMSLSKSNGTRMWDTGLYSGAQSPPVVVGNTVIVGTEENGAYVLDAANGRVLQTLALSGGSLNQIAVDSNRLFVLSSSSVLYGLIVP
ncbi:PQQ-binding-like beta-propeller repeat protein [bacterium]|nr:PQQ-binding-like beta-propeller repeat protein [bacterium]